MRRLLLAACLLIGGCDVGVTEGDQRGVRREFSQQSYEQAMRDSGRAEELEAEKRRAAEHLQGGSSR